MKQRLLLFLIFSSLFCFSQDKKKDKDSTYVVVYDFKTGTYDKNLFRPKVDRPIVYKIININRLAFDVRVNSSDLIVAETDWFTSAAELKKITEMLAESTPPTSYVTVPILENSKLGPNASMPSQEKNKINEDIKNFYELEFLKNELRLKESEWNALMKETKMMALSKIDKDSLVNQNLTAKIESVEKQRDSLVRSIQKHETIKNEKLNKFYEAKDKFYNAYNEFMKLYDRINAVVLTSNMVLPVSRLPFLNYEEYENKYKVEFTKMQTNLVEETISVAIFNTAYTNLVVSYNKVKDIEDLNKVIDERSVKAIYDELDLRYEQIRGIKVRVDLINFESLLQQVLRVLHLLEKSDSYEFISAPIQPKNDMATFQVEIKAKNKDLEVDNSRTFTHNEFIRRGTRIDFSIGLAGSYFNNTNVYEIYTANGENRIGLKNKNLTVPSLVTMISMTNRGSKYVAFGGSAGLGIDINNGRIQMSNFFIGPTVVLGKYDRLMFTPGLALRNVGKLKSGYEVANTVITESNDIDTVLSDNYKLGFFVALTYNLTNNVRDKISKLN